MQLAGGVSWSWATAPGTKPTESMYATSSRNDGRRARQIAVVEWPEQDGPSEEEQWGYAVSGVDAVEIVTINRPEARNAIDHDTAAALDDAFDELTQDDDVLAVIITGAGDKAFSAGMDLKIAASGARVSKRPRGGFAGMTRRQFPKPLLAAVNGFGLRRGLRDRARVRCRRRRRACNLRASGGEARDHCRRGRTDPTPKIIPPKVALELAMTGDTLDASRAYQLGLVNRVVAAHLLLEETIAIADRICANAPVAVRVSERVMWGRSRPRRNRSMGTVCQRCQRNHGNGNPERGLARSWRSVRPCGKDAEPARFK